MLRGRVEDARGAEMPNFLAPFPANTHHSIVRRLHYLSRILLTKHPPSHDKCTISSHILSCEAPWSPASAVLFCLLGPWDASGEMGRVPGGLTMGKPALPPVSMKRASPSRQLENGPRTGAFFGPQFLLRGVLEPQTRGGICGLNCPKPGAALTCLAEPGLG